MRKHLSYGISSIFAILLLSSCSYRIIDFTIISSKNVPITNEGNNFEKATSRVTGVDSKWSILFAPGVPSMKEAIDRAIEKHPGAIALTDGVVYNKSWTCLLFGQNKYIVEGTPLFSAATKYSSPKTNYIDVDSTQQPVQELAVETGTIKVFHTVDIKETMATIALLYKVTVPDIIKWNKLSSNTVYKGMKLTIYIK